MPSISCLLLALIVALMLWSSTYGQTSLQLDDMNTVNTTGALPDSPNRPEFIPHSGGGKRHRCGGLKHSTFTRPCARNDTLCGHWKGRSWHALGCHYEDITPEQARKCVGNRTLAFIGDSQIRDIAVGVAMLLLGQSIEDSPDEKFDYKQDMNANGTQIPDFKEWSHNVPGHNHNGHIFPQPDIAKQYGFEWQVQMWSLFRNEFFYDGQIEDVLTNKMPTRWDKLRNIDFGFWSHGLHDYGWWNEEPYGEKFFSSMMGMWMQRRKTIATFPTVWISMNPECAHKIAYALSGTDKQAHMVEEANHYANQKTLSDKIPYWDAGAVLRSPDRCNVSDDGVHVKMWVDVMRAKMLFNHLCDSDMNWRGSIEHFI